MHEGAAAVAREAGRHFPLGNDELARSLTLVRASTMRVLRLQLAIERKDRRTVLQTVDELVEIDSALRDFVEDIPGLREDILTLHQELDQQRSALAHEKLALVGGINLGKRTAPDAPELPIGEPLPASQIESCEGVDAAEPAEEASNCHETPAKRRLNPFALILAAALMLAVGIILWFFAVSQEGQVLSDQFIKWIGA